jgi:hypothetical protein
MISGLSAGETRCTRNYIFHLIRSAAEHTRDFAVLFDSFGSFCLSHFPIFQILSALVSPPDESRDFRPLSLGARGLSVPLFCLEKDSARGLSIPRAVCRRALAATFFHRAILLIQICPRYEYKPLLRASSIDRYTYLYKSDSYRMVMGIGARSARS